MPKASSCTSLTVARRDLRAMSSSVWRWRISGGHRARIPGMTISSRHLMRTALATGAVALALAGCSANSNGASDSSSDGMSSGSLVAVAALDGANVLQDGDGHTLYSA